VVTLPASGGRHPQYTGTRFYEAEALRCGWSVQQLDRQIPGQFYTRVLLSKNKRVMLEKGSVARRALEGDADGNAIISSGHRNEPIRQRRSVVA
jgi:predicted nuclease of restriction endonuclease-like (RecB) superfamily